MQSLRSSILKYVRVNVPLQVLLSRAESRSALNILNLQIRACSCSGATNQDQIKEQVLNLVKKFDKIDATKVTESADFQKDLSLDSLDRVELVMAFEEEFSIEIPDEEADKLKCCADVAQYIISGAQNKARESS
ncbi:acyl carrier protein 3, mitochondrial [Lycium barbarum]|uniref:acyl carrier protein 3, mitochondrial n=1 Tax=Lycium barbarum TaxID=112863 RepID=UPI00293F2A03|nr:acyl carrier protein 3, mitochondrial [Lycium barbarum]XP_060185989.1 acyl carrier protein 3, mitochondrial [Lycium barbarum]XP_060185990.1 acyl carrier protein 3, mitochondrial [Lycium barbarum]